MKLNKKLAGIIAGALCLITIGGIAAYLTSTKTLRNTITVGHNEIDIIETFEPPAALIPGTTFRKEVSVKNTGPVACYVRVMVTPNDIMAILNDGVRLSSKYAQEDSSGHLPYYNNRDWELVESETGIASWFYYKEPLQPGEETTSLFDHITLLEELRPVDTGSDVIDDPNEVPSWMEDFDLTVYAESYQAENEDGPFENYEAAWAHYQMNRPIWNLNENSTINVEYINTEPIILGQELTPDMFHVTATDEEGHVMELQPYIDYITAIDESDYIPEAPEDSWVPAYAMQKNTKLHILVSLDQDQTIFTDVETTAGPAVSLLDEGVQINVEFDTTEPIVVGEDIYPDQFKVTATTSDGKTFELIPGHHYDAYIPTTDPDCDFELDENHRYNYATATGPNTEVTLIFMLGWGEMTEEGLPFITVPVNVPAAELTSDYIDVQYTGPELTVGDIIQHEDFKVVLTDHQGHEYQLQAHDDYGAFIQTDDPDSSVITSNGQYYEEAWAKSTSNTVTIIVMSLGDNNILKTVEIPAKDPATQSLTTNNLTTTPPERTQNTFNNTAKTKVPANNEHRNNDDTTFFDWMTSLYK